MTYKVEDFGPFTLSVGKHDSPQDGMCFTEMVAFLAGEEWSDKPACASPVVSRFCQVLNDRMGQDFRDKLKTYALRVIGTASPEHDQERAEYLAWQAIKVFAPIALDAAGFSSHATVLRDFDISQGFDVARDAAYAAYAAYAARDAARDAAYAAHAAAREAHAAAHAAADDAADDAADAAADAAHAAAYAAHAADAAFECLDGLLAIGPSGDAVTPAHIERANKLRDLVS